MKLLFSPHQTLTSSLRLSVMLVESPVGLASLNHRDPSEKLNESKRNYFTYKKKLYAIVRALDHWNHYLQPKQFVIHSNHQELKFIGGQHNINPRHVKWVEFVQSFSFVSHYKQGVANTVAEVLSRRYFVIVTLDARVLGI